MNKIEKPIKKKKIKGYIFGFLFCFISGVTLAVATVFFEMAGIELYSSFKIILFIIGLIAQLAGGVINFASFSYLRAAIAAPMYGVIQIVSGSILALILIPGTPWNWYYLLILILVSAALILIMYNISRKPELEEIDELPPYPTLEISRLPDQNFDHICEGFSKIWELLDINLMAKFGRIRSRWTMPGGKYTNSTLWNSSLVSFVWKYWVSEIATEIMDPFLDKQTSEGLIPGSFGLFTTQKGFKPPILSLAYWNNELDIEKIKEIYPKISEFNEWIYNNRQDSSGLFYWKTPKESNMENSLRFEGIKKNEPSQHIAAIDLNCYMIIQNNILIKMAEKLNLDKDISLFKEKSQRLKDLIIKKLWDNDLKIFSDYNLNEKSFINLKSICGFLPLLAEAASDDQINILLGRLGNPEEFFTPIPLPTVAIDDPRFDNSEYNGPVWLSLSYLIIKGVEKIEPEFASKISFKLVNNIMLDWQKRNSFYEYYDPHFPHNLTTKPKPKKNIVGWTGLINSLLIETILGIKLNKEKILIRPYLPEEFIGLKILYNIRAMDLIIEYTFNSPDNIQLKVDYKGKTELEQIKNGALMEFSLD
jgi:hypothetical protein